MGYRGSNYLNKVVEKNNVLIAVHRGSYGGNILQNTIAAYEAAMQMGADMIEIDVAKSKDGVLYGFHTDCEPYLGLTKKIHELTSDEIDESCCTNILGVNAGASLSRFEDVLNYLRGKCLINVDRAWFCWEETIDIIAKANMQEYVLLKSPVHDEYLKTLADSKTNIMFMPIVYNIEEVNRAKTFEVNLVALELIFDSLEHELVSDSQMKMYAKEGLLTWVNAIDLGVDFNLSGGLTDTNAIICSPDENWGRLIDMGFNILQTDWPAILKRYIISRC